MSGPVKLTIEQLDALAAVAPLMHYEDGARHDALLIEQRPMGAVAVEPDGGHGPTIILALNGELRPDDDEYGATLPPPVVRARPTGLRGIPGDLAVPEPQRWCAKCARYVPIDEHEAPRHHAPDCPEYIPF